MTTAADLAAWRAALGWSQRQAAAALGLTLKGYQELERGCRFSSGLPAPIDRRTALACAALAARLPPIGEDPTSTGENALQSHAEGREGAEGRRVGGKGQGRAGKRLTG